MDIFLKNVFDRVNSEEITAEQALYLISINSEDDIKYTTSVEVIAGLVKKNLLKNSDEPAKVLYLKSANIGGNELTGTISAIYDSELSKAVVRKLASLLCMRDESTKELKLPGDSGSDTVMTTAELYLSKEGLIAFHYIIFLYLFPIKGKYNRKWEKHFTGVEYNGAKLRTRSKATGSAFLKIAKTKDIGAFLYGTYLFVKASIQGTETFIKSMTNYMKEYDEWYYTGLEAIKEAKDIDDLFEPGSVSKEGRLIKGL